MKKQLAIAILAATAIIGNSYQAQAATALSYYSFNWPDNYHTSYSNSSFSVSDGTVVINGWQTLDRMPASNYYSVVKKGTFSDTYASNEREIKIDGNFSQTGTWYTREFTGVPNSSGYYIRIDNGNYGHNEGAGNAY